MNVQTFKYILRDFFDVTIAFYEYIFDNFCFRFQDALATRSPPPPVLPDGPAHKLYGNYYFTRDARREVSPPEVIAPAPKQLEGGEANAVKRITPGPVFKWD